METVTTSHFISSFTNNGGIASSDPKLTLINNGLKKNNQMIPAHNGLRSLKNNVDMIKLRTTAKNATEELRIEKSGIKCGMKLVFVGAEVAPWSKTGGLGDVLGGLPAALAVSLCSLHLEIFGTFLNLSEHGVKFFLNFSEHGVKYFLNLSELFRPEDTV